MTKLWEIVDFASTLYRSDIWDIPQGLTLVSTDLAILKISSWIYTFFMLSSVSSPSLSSFLFCISWTTLVLLRPWSYKSIRSWKMLKTNIYILFLHLPTHEEHILNLESKNNFKNWAYKTKDDIKLKTTLCGVGGTRNLYLTPRAVWRSRGREPRVYKVQRVVMNRWVALYLVSQMWWMHADITLRLRSAHHLVWFTSGKVVFNTKTWTMLPYWFQLRKLEWAVNSHKLTF